MLKYTFSLLGINAKDLFYVIVDKERNVIYVCIYSVNLLLSSPLCVRYPSNILSLVKFQYGLYSSSPERPEADDVTEQPTDDSEVWEEEDDPSRFWGLQAAVADKEVC